MATFFSGTLGALASSSSYDDQLRADASQASGEIRVLAMPFDIATATLTNADIVRVGSLPTNARILEVRLYLEALGTGGSVDLGVFGVGGSGQHDGAVVEVDTFADGYDVSSAIAGVDIFTTAVGGGGGFTVLDEHRCVKDLWELADESSDPGGTWDLGFTINNKGTNDFTGILIVQYTND